MATLNKKGIDIILKAQDQTKSAFGSLDKNIKGIESVSRGAGKALKKMGLATAGLATGMGVALSKYASFEKRMHNIGTLLNGNTKHMKELEEGILSLSLVTPVSADELGAGAYDIVSASVKGVSNQLHVLKESAKLSEAGLGTLEESADLLTSAINAFGIDAEDANDVANILF